MEPRPSECPTRRSRASGTRVGGRKDSAGIIAPANVCAHNHHKRAPEGTAPPPRGLAGPISSPWSPAHPDAQPAGAKLPGQGSAAGRTGRKEVLKKRCNTRTSQEVTHPSTTLAQAR
ncbi:hypothetical protein PIB30_114304 [Stylosanthes scabra]|uniref:Uncharacterized protein n=1 Tax=Stylosanthes scabra TaxID=79078 RepID=A0ABU6Z2D3_9FABA|nr:hypothetical protein [Stylosanthes scabra]